MYIQYIGDQFSLYSSPHFITCFDPKSNSYAGFPRKFHTNSVGGHTHAVFGFVACLFVVANALDKFPHI